jgi:hypothetical protein
MPDLQQFKRRIVHSQCLMVNPVGRRSLMTNRDDVD